MSSNTLLVCSALIGGTCTQCRLQILAAAPSAVPEDQRGRQGDLELCTGSKRRWHPKPFYIEAGVLSQAPLSSCNRLGFAGDILQRELTLSCRSDSFLQMGSGTKSALVPMNCPICMANTIQQLPRAQFLVVPCLLL